MLSVLQVLFLCDFQELYFVFTIYVKNNFGLTFYTQSQQNDGSTNIRRLQEQCWALQETLGIAHQDRIKIEAFAHHECAKLNKECGKEREERAIALARQQKQYEAMLASERSRADHAIEDVKRESRVLEERLTSEQSNFQAHLKEMFEKLEQAQLENSRLALDVKSLTERVQGEETSCKVLAVQKLSQEQSISAMQAEHNEVYHKLQKANRKLEEAAAELCHLSSARADIVTLQAQLQRVTLERTQDEGVAKLEHEKLVKQLESMKHTMVQWSQLLAAKDNKIELLEARIEHIRQQQRLPTQDASSPSMQAYSPQRRQLPSKQAYSPYAPSMQACSPPPQQLAEHRVPTYPGIPGLQIQIPENDLHDDKISNRPEIHFEKYEGGDLEISNEPTSAKRCAGGLNTMPAPFNPDISPRHVQQHASRFRTNVLNFSPPPMRGGEPMNGDAPRQGHAGSISPARSEWQYLSGSRVVSPQVSSGGHHYSPSTASARDSGSRPR